MEINAILGALIGAIVGAIAWAAIAAFTGYEIGLIAWAVGGAVGLGAYVMEGRGATSGIVCAVLALLAILAGKFMAIHAVAAQEMEQIAALGGQAIYQEIAADAAAFALLTSQTEYPAFMVTHEYTEAETPEDVFDSELEVFKSEQVPYFTAWNANPPTFDQWKAENFGTGDLPIGEIFMDSFSVIDILFFALGIGTAFRLGSGGEFE